MRRVLAALLLTTLPGVIQAQVKNGFDLSDSSIDASDIHQGGPPRDGIPSIDDPKFVSGEAADFLSEDDRIIGVYRSGIAKAYPIRILDWHEVVNDDIAGAPTLVTYCPLCGTGMVFNVAHEEIDFTFGVSGLLYNSDVLLYDRQTGSLWSQIMSQAVNGPMKGTHLPAIPARHTKWSAWKTEYPNTVVLSTDTGYRRDYDNSPYLGYDRSNRLMFDVEHRSRAYSNKDLVLGISVGDAHRAYPFEELEKQGRDRFVDRFAGQQFTILWSESADSAHVLDESGNEVATVLAYWFAWYAFHPDTEIFRSAG